MEFPRITDALSKVPTMTVSLRAGVLRIALAGIVTVLVSLGWSLPEAGVAYVAAALAALFGVLLISGHPRVESTPRRKARPTAR